MVDTVGKWVVDTRGITKPKALVDYLESKIINKKDVHILAND